VECDFLTPRPVAARQIRAENFRIDALPADLAAKTRAVPCKGSAERKESYGLSGGVILLNFTICQFELFAVKFDCAKLKMYFV
jgi:hypothetical protein